MVIFSPTAGLKRNSSLNHRGSAQIFARVLSVLILLKTFLLSVKIKFREGLHLAMRHKIKLIKLISS
jgi:hypothetical protein